MYDLGVQDAEQGEPRAFYYQHYYHYRRGYDETRRKLGRGMAAGIAGVSLPRIAAAAGVVVVLMLLSMTLFRREPSPEPVPLAAPTSAATTPTIGATRTPIFPTATRVPPTPTSEPFELRIGRSAVVGNPGGRPLRGRAEPSLLAPARVAFNEGDVLMVIDGPVEADGYTWWRVEGTRGIGWSAEASPDGSVWLLPQP
ncbi:MAG TPA: hypothetical protein PKA05_17555 [Roseiflexaceae bacterium]|nr:hypothetical protein [Roseiflexaceae bacterium]